MLAKRQSNLELLRIIAMLLIVMGHYIGHAGFPKLYDFSSLTVNMVFLQFTGEWGKTAINAFVLITGYFMCTSVLTPKRLIKLVAEVYFYNVLIFLIFLIFKREVLSAISLIELLFWPLKTTNLGFTTSFLWFYLFIPFYNVLISGISKKQLYYLIASLLGMFTISTTFFYNFQVFHYVMWYVVIYFIGAAIRMYPMKWMNTNRICLPLLALSVAFAWTSMALFDVFGGFGPIMRFTHFLCQSDRFAALIVGTSLFLVFKNWHIAYNKVINGLASTCFGVLLIHANSDAMRKLLWHDLVDCEKLYAQPLFSLALISFMIPIIVFVICSVIDSLRIKFLERPLIDKMSSMFKWLDSPMFGIMVAGRQ